MNFLKLLIKIDKGLAVYRRQPFPIFPINAEANTVHNMNF